MEISSNELIDVFRDPIHGLIEVFPWEKKLIGTEEFQRLRRIHQLGMTNLIYHGAEHTRFGHSIGVMHIAGRIMDHLRRFEPLNHLEEDEFLEKRAMVRMAGLLHDIGHGCYSHIGEDSKIYPDLIDPSSGQMSSGHEAYTRCIIKERLSSVIEEYWPEGNMVSHILMILNQSSDDAEYRFFDDIISGQLDCDKMDYLLRDSHYCGVEYGVYDLNKLIASLRVAKINGNSVLAISQNGIQAVESFLFARYWMFIQVYFHKYRRLYDYYLSSFLKEFLLLECEKSGKYPSALNGYLKLDDVCLYNKIRDYALKEECAMEEKRICSFAKRLYERTHHKVVFDPPYVHYNNSGKEEIEDYKRLTYVKKHLSDYLETIKEEDKFKIYIDLATGSSTKQYFDIKVYNEEQDPDFNPSVHDVEVPAIPVISKHNGKLEPIQKYSFSLRSISDRKLGILRVYAEGDKINEIPEKCSVWFTEKYDEDKNKLDKIISREQELIKELEETERSKRELKETLSMDNL